MLNSELEMKMKGEIVASFIFVVCLNLQTAILVAHFFFRNRLLSHSFQFIFL